MRFDEEPYVTEVDVTRILFNLRNFVSFMISVARYFLMFCFKYICIPFLSKYISDFLYTFWIIREKKNRNKHFSRNYQKSGTENVFQKGIKRKRYNKNPRKRTRYQWLDLLPQTVNLLAPPIDWCLSFGREHFLLGHNNTELRSTKSLFLLKFLFELGCGWC